MTHTRTLLRGMFLALVFALVAPVAGFGGTLLGAASAQAQTGDPLISAVLFEGNQAYTDAELLTMVDTATRGIASPAVIAADAESIRLAYQSRGFTNVTVTTRVEPSDTGRVRVVFFVDEGQRSGIAAINFTGNHSIDSGTLKSIIRTRETHLLSWLFRDDTYDPNLITVDKELIRVYYANRGFPDAIVTSAVAEFDAARNAYFISFSISEGERYSFSDVAIETSIPGLDADALRGTVRTQIGSRYSLADLERTQSDMALEATAQGYPFADVRPRINRDPATNTFRVTYLVDEGPRLYVERVDIVGNLKTRDFVIRRELGFNEGDPFNRSMIVRARRNIEGLGFFKSVTIDLQPGTAADRVRVTITVVEDSTGDYGATVGYASDEGLLGELSITERNFLGRGQYVRASVGATERGNSFNFSFTEPRFMGLRVSAGVDLYHRIVNEGSGYYGYTATGGQVRLGAPITRDLTGSIYFGGETRAFVDEEAPFSSFGPSGLDDGSLDGEVRNKAWVGYNLVYNALDDTKRPTEGLYATLSQQYIGLDYNLLKTEVRARYFMPLMDTGIVASVRGQAGAIISLDGSGVSPLEAFQPGAQLVRGFQARQWGPRLSGTGEVTGYTMYAGLSGEIEFPIPVLPETYGIRGAVWADSAWVEAGDLALGAGTIDPDSVDEPLKASVGASLIWDGPFGPLRGDFGYKVQGSTLDQGQFFQLTISNLL